LVLLCFYIKPLSLPGCSLTASWPSSGAWARLLKRPSMRALIRTSYGVLLALMRLTAPLVLLSVCSHGLIFLWMLHFRV
jgi:hypothetical protein